MIRGWIRCGDKADCGGTVSEDLAHHMRFDKPVAFVGAKLVCDHHCIVAEGHPTFTDNGRPIPYHLHKSSRGCKIHSTLNGIDGWEDGNAVADIENSLTHGGGVGAPFASIHEAVFDEQAALDELHAPGLPYHIETSDGRMFSGRVGAYGKLPRIETSGAGHYTLHIGEEALLKQDGFIP